MPLGFARSILAGGSAPKSYELYADSEYVNEGDSVTINLSTQNVSDGATVPYTISGITSADLSSGSTSGNFTVSGDSASVSLTLASDALSEGLEVLQFQIYNPDSGDSEAALNINVNDTSRTASFAANGATDTTPNEGNTYVAYFRATNYSGNMYWTTNATTADVTYTSGQCTLTSVTTSGDDTYYNYSANLGTIKIDSLTEGNETFTVYFRQGSTGGTSKATQTFTIQDTSKTTGYYGNGFSDSTPNEGTTLTFYFSSRNLYVSPGYWYIGSASGDINTSGSTMTYSGTTTSGNDTYYNYYGQVSITADLATEGNETKTVQWRSASGGGGTLYTSQNFTIQDTSVENTQQIYSFTSGSFGGYPSLFVNTDIGSNTVMRNIWYNFLYNQQFGYVAIRDGGTGSPTYQYWGTYVPGSYSGQTPSVALTSSGGYQRVIIQFNDQSTGSCTTGSNAYSGSVPSLPCDFDHMLRTTGSNGGNYGSSGTTTYEPGINQVWTFVQGDH